MFDRIKKALGKEAKPEAAPSTMHAGPVSEWAATQGFGFSVDGTGQNIALEGKVGGRPWKLVLGKPTRNYIFGEEVRGRSELGIDESVAVLVMNRPLKEALEKRAYEVYTNDLQTSVDSSMPEEMRWLAMFEEVGWESLPDPFWTRLAILTDNKDSALAWIDTSLADLMTAWPVPAPSAEVPFIVLLLNGKAYLRMEYTPAELGTLQHAALIFTHACENALAAFKKK
ncbi:MAG TPA: hypothetical protein VMZ74_09000 [Ramlibacter sp.]|nr:hypothetical protein [Ramlibacter sp.]